MLTPEHIAFACFYSDCSQERGLAVVGVCPCSGLASINLSAHKHSANRKQNNGPARSRGEGVRSCKHRDRETLTLHPITHTLLLSGDNRNIWHHCPPSLTSLPHHRDEDRRYNIQSCRKRPDPIWNNCMESGALRSNAQRERWEGTTKTGINRGEENSGQAAIKRGMREWKAEAPILDGESLLAREGKIRGQVVFCSLKDLRQLATLSL